MLSLPFQMTFTPPDVASLTQSLRRWEWAEYAFAALVTIGCFGEYVANFTDWFTDGSSERTKRLEKRSTLLLVAALALELICLVRTNYLSGSLIGSLSEKSEQAASDAALANDRSKEAVARAEDAKQTTNSLADKVASVNEDADAVAHRLESASRQLIGLQKRLLTQGPRWRLLEAGKSEFVKTLRPFAGQRITFVRCGLMGGLEPSKLESDLRTFLGDGGAGWVEGDGYWKKCDSTWDFGGNLVVFGPSASDAVKDAAKGLGNILNTLKITTFTTQHTREHRQVDSIVFGDDSPFELTAKDPTVVFLLVGLHPMFDLAATNDPAEKDKDVQKLKTNDKQK